VRFSNGSHQTGADALLGSVTGLGLKLFGIDGPTLLEDEPDSGTFDYAMINYPVFFANTVEHYVFIHELILFSGAPPTNESADQAKERAYQFLHDFLTGRDTLPPEEWAWDELGVFLALAQIKPINLLLSTYWTMGAVRHGDYIAKVRVAPVQASADRVVRRALNLASAPEVFRPALVAELQERPYEFDIQVQLCVDLDYMPVEDVTVPWSETLSPFVTVAKLRLPRQDIGGDDNLEKMDATSLTPWRCTEAHRPLGNIQRVRKEVYRQSSILRHQLNHQVRKEPTNLAEVFGVSTMKR
jgi:catalase